MKLLAKGSIALTLASILVMLSVVMVCAEDQIELRLTWWGSQSRHDKTIEVIKAYADDGAALGYDDDQKLIDYVKMLLRLQEAGAYPSREVELSEYWNAGPEGSALVQGKAIMAHYWSNQIGAIWKAAGEDRNLMMTHVPRPADGCCAANYIKPSMFFSITKDAKHPKEAALFISFFINSTEVGEILGTDRGVPISSVVREALKAQLDKPSREMFAYLERVQEDSSPIRPPDPAVHSDIYNNVYLPEFIDPVLLHEISPEEGVENLRMMATDILENQ